MMDTESSTTSVHSITFRKTTIAITVTASNLATKYLVGLAGVSTASSESKKHFLYGGKHLGWDKENSAAIT
jgi:hypothetical protein